MVQYFGPVAETVQKNQRRKVLYMPSRLCEQRERTDASESGRDAGPKPYRLPDPFKVLK